MLAGLMYPNGLVWHRVDLNKKEDNMMLGLMYMVEAEKRARQARERQLEAEQGTARVPAPARKPVGPRAEPQRKPQGFGRLVAVMGGIGW